VSHKKGVSSMSVEPQQNVSLAPYTTLGVGGVAKYFVVVKDVEELRAAWRFAKQTATPPFILGGGSNLLIADGVIDRTVIKPELQGVVWRENSTASTTTLTVAAGEDWDALVATAVARGLAGLENLSGIPGTVGAAPVQNINAYGAAVADVVESVEVFDGDTEAVRTLTNAACQFEYRDSIFKQPAGKNLTVTAVTLRLAPAGHTNLVYRSASQSIGTYLAERGITEPTPSDVRDAVLWARGNIGMLAGQFRSAGSFFKNVIVSAEQFAILRHTVETTFPELSTQLSPWHWSLPDGREKISTAFLLECSPYNKRTYGTTRINGVGLSPKHSLSIVTEPNATATAVSDFVALVTEAVAELFGVTIESEVVCVG
jgi:UDP-N-acetylmuramate dehydrogenase